MPLRRARQPPPVESREEFRAVGRVERPWGLRGDLKVLPLTDFSERFAVGARLFLAGEERAVVAGRWQKGRVYLRLAGIESEAAAEALRGELLEVRESDRAVLAEGEYYLDEIVGCAVRGETGEAIGIVREVLQPGANDVYVVARRGQRDLLLPAIADVVRRVDIERKEITVDLPEGLDPDAPAAASH